MSQLGNALFTTTQQKVLGLLYANSERTFYTKEILRLTGMGVATIKRELDRMLACGILTMTKIGNQHHYQANHECPVYEELSGIVKKTFGIGDVVRSALVTMSDNIDWAFIYGSVASGKETAGSDIDLMVISDATFSDVVGALHQTQEILGREINPKVYSKKQWLKMKKNKNIFIKDVLSKSGIDVIGDGHGFGKPGRKNLRKDRGG